MAFIVACELARGYYSVKIGVDIALLVTEFLVESCDILLSPYQDFSLPC